MAATDTRIAEVLGPQRGYAARWQLLDAGVRAHCIDARLAADRLFIVGHGVYSAIPPQGTRWESVMVAVLACGPGALASHWTAAELEQLVREGGGVVHVLSPGDFARRHAGVRDHRIARLDPEDARSCDGIPCTSVPLTLLDLAGLARRRFVERAVDRAIVEGRCSEQELASVVERHPGRRGANALRTILATHEVGTTDTRSPDEEEFLAFLRRHDLRLPAFNVPRLLPSGRRVVFDALWEDAGLVVELDARSTHDTPLRFEDDRERDLEATLLGLRPVRITRRRMRDEPARLADQLRALTEAGGSTRRRAEDSPDAR